MTVTATEPQTVNHRFWKMLSFAFLRFIHFHGCVLNAKAASFSLAWHKQREVVFYFNFCTEFKKGGISFVWFVNFCT